MKRVSGGISRRLEGGERPSSRRARMIIEFQDTIRTMDRSVSLAALNSLCINTVVSYSSGLSL